MTPKLLDGIDAKCFSSNENSRPCFDDDTTDSRFESSSKMSDQTDSSEPEGDTDIEKIGFSDYTSSGSLPRSWAMESGVQGGTWNHQAVNSAPCGELISDTTMASSIWSTAPIEQSTRAWPADAACDGRDTTVRLARAALAAADGTSGLPPAWTGVYTVMMRNLPNKFTKDLLLQSIDKAGFLQTYDFVYLPIDHETGANRGYAFINFYSPGLAFMFKNHFDGWKFCSFDSNKVVSVVAATLQGFDANYARYYKAPSRQAEPGAQPVFLRPPKDDKEASRRRQRQRRYSSLIDIAARKQEKSRDGEPSKQDADAQKARVGSQADPAKQFSSKPDSPGTICQACGGGLQSNFRFCLFCGNPVVC
jgi:hypothetical protein